MATSGHGAKHEEEDVLTTYERRLVNKVRNCCKWGILAAKKGYRCHLKSISIDRLFNMITTKKMKLESKTSINRHINEIKEMNKCKDFHKTFTKCCRREVMDEKKKANRS
ncbi:uncharacterized protein TRIADDRAFT_57949 [Trichoplax adhaerens]|uniref:Uncharacterized protein n=1 Tax=Trichoplax adhaerens TaxID=10228 RepID=B3S272_TRIAD|nr:predicted protein [Trichoplax adhaerens]EDV23381.1 predicted protein [Trichoplax adhaerens]|eukprot:XP_002114291.1 predicted protein [Trichoplax adhaerens]